MMTNSNQQRFDLLVRFSAPPAPPPKKQATAPAKRTIIEPKSAPKKSATPPAEPEPTIILESYYYGTYTKDQLNDNAVNVDFEAQCPECYDKFNSNIELMTHLQLHATGINIPEFTGTQCRYCCHQTADKEAQKKHMAHKHPTETKSISGGYACLLCEEHMNTTAILTAHMKKTHNRGELPFKCLGCDFASSARYHTIDHFYEKHSGSGMLQCPFCLKIFGAVNVNGSLPANIENYMIHVRLHGNKDSNNTCARCSLHFLRKSELKAHILYDHINFKHFELKGMKAMCNSFTKIPKVRDRNHANNKDAPNFVGKLSRDMIIYMDNGTVCLECDNDFGSDNHIVGTMKCLKASCNYRTNCTYAMCEHNLKCSATTTSEFTDFPLSQEMHCICGFSIAEGNALARHLASCERKTAYPTVEVANENIVKRNMLDMLGLVRRGDDDGDDTSDLPDGENVGSSTYQPVEADTGGNVDQFNTQLSLDDLAVPSVAPPPVPTEHEPELDRTPQLRDEYQSLATPRVSHNVDERIDRDETSVEDDGVDAEHLLTSDNGEY